MQSRRCPRRSRIAHGEPILATQNSLVYSILVWFNKPGVRCQQLVDGIPPLPPGEYVFEERIHPAPENARYGLKELRFTRSLRVGSGATFLSASLMDDIGVYRLSFS